MITVDQLRAQRDEIFRSQLAEVEAAINAAITGQNALGVTVYVYDTASLSAGQLLWLVEHYQANGFQVHQEEVEVDGEPAVRLTFEWR
jgi:hypothetical protein